MAYLQIQHGITGNYYACSDSKEVVKDICQRLGKSTKSIYYNRKYERWAIKVKLKTHKAKLKIIQNEIMEFSNAIEKCNENLK